MQFEVEETIFHHFAFNWLEDFTKTLKDHFLEQRWPRRFYRSPQLWRINMAIRHILVMHPVLLGSVSA
jgi:hypothetical protein